MPNWLKIPDNCPASLTLIGFTVVVFIAQIATQGEVTNQGVLYGPAVMHGQWWRLATSGFLHGNAIHIAFNMYLLYVLGPQLERMFGSLRFLLIYFGAMLGSAATVMMFDWIQPTLGASGAALGLAGAMGVILYQRGMKPQQSPVFGLVVLNLALPLLVPGISFWGHFGGIFSGALMAYILIWLPLKMPETFGSTSISLGIAAIAFFSATAVFVAKIEGLAF